jgi:hypothetical protein
MAAGIERAYIADDSLRHVVAGMLSTIDFVPSEVHPGNMVNIAEKVIHHIRVVDSETSQPEAQPEGPFEGQDTRY